MSKYLLDKVVTVAFAGTVLALEMKNIKDEIWNGQPGAVYLWADVGDFSRFRNRQAFSIDNQSQLQINQSTEEIALIHAQY